MPISSAMKRSEKRDLQARHDGAAEGADLEDVLEPAQGKPLRREGQIGGVAERRADDDDERQHQEQIDQRRDADEDGMRSVGHHVAMGLMRRAIWLIARTMEMVITVMMAAIVEAPTQSKDTMARC